MTETRDATGTKCKRLALIAAGTLAGVVAGFAGVYGFSTFTGKSAGDPTCRPAVELARKLAPLAHGEVAAVSVATAPLKVPDLTFTDGNGKAATLADFKGRTVLLNLWATWCVPCRKEMPTLDALEGKLGGPAFQVVAVNIDTRDPDKPKAFLKQIGVERLAYYADPSARTFQELKRIGRALGMPTTMLIDKEGCELGTIAGPAEWASDDAVKLIEAASDAQRVGTGLSPR
jgi:thiol-disulfide isomerase/thioredoxin